MNRTQIIDEIIENSKLKNIEDIEVYIKRNSSMELNIYEGNIEKHLISSEENLALRGIYKGKMGYSYTEKFTDENIEELLNNLIQYAENNENQYIEKMSSGIDESLDLKRDTNSLDKYSDDEKIKFLLDLEGKALKKDKRVKTISSCNYIEKTENVYIKNTLGLEVEDSYRKAVITLGVVAENEGSMQTGYSHLLIDDLKEEYKDKLIKNSVEDAVSMLGAESVAPDIYRVVLRNNVVADMFSYFSSVFSASQVQRNLSLMKGKIGKQIAVDFLNIIEDPMMKNGAINRTFDDEGTINSKKYIIKDGVLNTFLHSKKTAELEGVKSTGNGFRRSHKSSIEVMATNLYIEEGGKSLDEMISSMRDGIIITDIHGLHAGINPTSGDFSLSSNGFLVEEGKYKRPLAQITVAGNIYDMFMEIEEIGNDTIFCHPSSEYFGSPSILVKNLNISGK